jgi:hypothetical protein
VFGPWGERLIATTPQRGLGRKLSPTARVGSQPSDVNEPVFARDLRVRDVQALTVKALTYLSHSLSGLISAQDAAQPELASAFPADLVPRQVRGPGRQTWPGTQYAPDGAALITGGPDADELLLP